MRALYSDFTCCFQKPKGKAKSYISWNFAWLTLCEWNCFTASVSMRKLQSKKSKLLTMDKSYKSTTLFFIHSVHVFVSEDLRHVFLSLSRLYLIIYRMSLHMLIYVWTYVGFPIPQYLEIWSMFLERESVSENLYAFLSFTVIKVRYGFHWHL